DKLRRQVNQIDQKLALEVAAKDTLRSYYDSKLHTVVYELQALVAEKEVLLKYSQDKAKEVAELIKKYNAVAGAIASTQVRLDTIVKYDTVYKDAANRDIRQVRLKSDHYDIGVRSYP